MFFAWRAGVEPREKIKRLRSEPVPVCLTAPSGYNNDQRENLWKTLALHCNRTGNRQPATGKGKNMGWIQKVFGGRAAKARQLEKEKAARARFVNDFHEEIEDGEKEDVIAEFESLGSWVLDATGYSNESSVSVAAAWGKTEILEWLLAVGAKPTRDPNGQTALMSAAAFDRLDCVKVLLTVVDPKERDQNGRDALNWALDNKHVSQEMLNLLVPLSDLNIKDRSGLTALGKAVGRDIVRAVKIIAPLADLTQTIRADSLDGARDMLAWEWGVKNQAWEAVDELGILPGGELWRENAWEKAGEHLPKITAAVEADKLREVVKEASSASLNEAGAPSKSAEPTAVSSRASARRI